MSTVRKKAKKAKKRSTLANQARRKPLKGHALGKGSKKVAARKRPTRKHPTKKSPTKRASRVTVAALAEKLREGILTASRTTIGDSNLPVALVASQYGPATKRTILAALNKLASEGLVTIVSDEFFKINIGRPPPE